MHEAIGFMADASRKLDAAGPGAAVDLSVSVEDWGYDTEAAEADRACGLEYETFFAKRRSAYERHVAGIRDVIEGLGRLGVEVHTGIDAVPPEPVVGHGGRDRDDDPDEDEAIGPSGPGA